MALSINTAWEIRPTNGSDTNSGGFVAGASGTDWSQQNAAQYAVSDGVTAGTTTITSATANFGTDVVGNIIYVAGGTGSVTAGWYQIVTRTNSTTIVVDRSTGLTAGTGVTLNIGGALKTIAAAAAIYVGSNKIFVKAEATISTTASIVFPTSSNNPPTTTTPPSRLIGYTTSRTDQGRVTIQLSTNTGLVALDASAALGFNIENFVIDCNSLGTSKGARLYYYSSIYNCKVLNFTSMGIDMVVAAGACNVARYCEVTAGTSAASAAIKLQGQQASVVAFCFIHDNACPGIVNSPGSAILYNLITNNSGASSDGIQSAVAGNHIIFGNTIYNNGRHGIFQNNISAYGHHDIRNNILAKNGGYGLVGLSAAGLPAAPSFDGNAYWTNTSGARNNADDTSTDPINSVAPYTNVLDVTLSADPFTNAAGGDFTLNNNAGGGAACRASGIPGAFVGVSSTPGHIDMGVFQHADPTPPIGVSRIIQNIGTY